MGIWVGRYAIVGNEVREHGPWFVERERRREDEVVRLLVVAEPYDERSAEFCSEVADAVAELFSRESLSITGGLLRSLRQAHSNLAEWNRRSLREHQVAVGLTCVALRDHEATVAQVGPGTVYASGSGGLLRYTTEGTPAAQPVGSEEAIQPHFFSVRIGEHSLLLLTSSVERMVGVNAVGQALATGPERALADLFLRTRNVRDMTAVLVAEVEMGEVAAPVETGAQDLREPWTPEPPPRAVDSGPDAAMEPRRTMPLPAVRRERGPYAAARALDRLRAPRADRGAIFAQWRPPPRIAALVAAVIAVVLLAWCTVPSLLEEDRGARADDALRAAQAHLAAAGNAEDATGSRRELRAALEEIARARSVGSSDPRIESLQAQVDQALAALDAVVDLGEGALRRVMAFDGAITAPFAMANVVSGGGALWLHDSQRGRIFRIDPSAAEPQAQEVYRSGNAYGTVTGRDPRALAWDAEGNRLLVLDSSLVLFSVAEGRQPAAIPIRGVRELRSAVALSAYLGSLYVLDPQGGEVWRFLPGGGGFDSEREGRLGGIEIADGRALAVDGDIFVLGGAGVRHFQQSREVAPLLQGIDRPLQGPTGVVVDASRQLAYVADRGGRRIVVSDRDGAYRLQYRHPQFFDLRGIAVAPDGSRVFALTGEGIFAFTPAFELSPNQGAMATATPAATATRPQATAAPTALATPPPPQVYVVVSGDTATSIAQRFGVTVAQLAAANNRSEASMGDLQVGDRLTIPR